MGIIVPIIMTRHIVDYKEYRNQKYESELSSPRLFEPPLSRLEGVRR